MPLYANKRIRCAGKKPGEEIVIEQGNVVPNTVPPDQVKRLEDLGLAVEAAPSGGGGEGGGGRPNGDEED